MLELMAERESHKLEKRERGNGSIGQVEEKDAEDGETG